MTKVFSLFRPDPLKRLNLDLGTAGKHLSGRARTSVPEPTQVERARVDAEVRAWRTTSPTAWPVPGCRRSGPRRCLGCPTCRTGSTVRCAATDLGVAKIPWWAGLVRVLQWLLILAALGGAGWLAALAVLSALQMSSPEPPDVGSVPVPTLLLVGGVVLGVLLALFCRLLVRATARHRAASADQRLRAAIARGRRGAGGPAGARPSWRRTPRCATGWSRRSSSAMSRAVRPGSRPQAPCRRCFSTGHGRWPRRCRRASAGWSEITPIRTRRTP